MQARQCFLLFHPKQQPSHRPAATQAGRLNPTGQMRFLLSPKVTGFDWRLLCPFPEKRSAEPAGQPLPEGFPTASAHPRQLSSGKGALSALSWQSCVTPASSSWVIYVALLVSWQYNAQNGSPGAAHRRKQGTQAKLEFKFHLSNVSVCL